MSRIDGATGYRRTNFRNYVNTHRPMASELYCNVTLAAFGSVLAYTVLTIILP